MIATPDRWLSIDGRPVRMATAPPLRVALGVLLNDQPWRDCPLGFLIAGIDDRAALNGLFSGILQHRVREADLQPIADVIARGWFGWHRWEARRLWDQALEMWPHIDGALISSGVDIEALAPDRATNAIFGVRMRWWRDGEDGEGLDRWINELTAAPMRVTLDPARIDQAEIDAEFAELFAASGGGMRTSQPVADVGPTVTRM
ncbi:hypothetical protein TPB0596_12520 [Tsukamurella pulmonis]|uniref:hypothetical protein n=1 Tax=Tsukamurella pulmonis TaxID=47312 RepID=UPI001EDF0F75|nr:hypothetical protein [Tsukamurella pulmonis]BDD81489.1 hypothetical protein TPB0596_12520 [Tsukamurella pulmonis]